jgi:hypothetical protein
MKITRQSGREAAGPLFVAAVAVVACVLQTVAYGPPIPEVHDEFSYLLAADTFLHGRLANPPHPLWQYFESMHILQQPTYASKYPPGQGLFLAAGRLMGGHPVPGVWLGMGLACGAATWMLRAYLPRWWAVCGGLLMASRLGFGQWGWSYWGGGVAVAGGALFVGGWARTLRCPHRFPSAVMAVGLTLLAVSRPFEGLLLCLPVCVATVATILRRRHPAGEIVRRAVVPALAVLLPAALALSYYNYRVTGNALRLPYMEHAAQYDVAPVLLVQEPYPLTAKTYRHEALRDYHVDYEFKLYQTTQAQSWTTRVRERFLQWWSDYLGYGLTLPLLALPLVLVQSPRTRFIVAVCLVVFGGVAVLETFVYTHYTAPAAALLYLPVVQGFRRIALIRPWRPAGRWFAATWLAGCLLFPGFNLFDPFWRAHLEPLAPRLWPWLANDLRVGLYRRIVSPFAKQRADLLAELQQSGNERHLIVVRYGPGHVRHEELVYNDADIDGARVVWARDMGPEELARLLRYFQDRTVWLLIVNRSDAQLVGPWKAHSAGGGRAPGPPPASQ